MRYAKLLLYLQLFLLMACGNDYFIVDVSNVDVVGDMSHFEVEVLIGGQSILRVEKPRAEWEARGRKFWAPIPASREGNLQVTVRGLNSDRCTMAEGVGFGTIDHGAQNLHLTIPVGLRAIDHSCTLIASKFGPGRLVASTLWSANSKCLPIESVCTAEDSCDYECESNVLKEKEIVFEVTDVPSGYQVFWASCPGTARQSRCTVTVVKRAKVMVFIRKPDISPAMPRGPIRDANQSFEREPVPSPFEEPQ